MQRYSTSLLLIVALMSAFQAWAIADTLIRKFAKDVTFIDLGAVFVLGLISGIATGVVFVFRRKPSDLR